MEIEIEKYLKKHNVLFEAQYRIKECRNKNPLPFDFAIQDKYNNLTLLIEYQGGQHYFPVDFSGKGKEWAEEQFKELQIRDQIKYNYCITNSIPLLIIPYWESNNIEEILNNCLLKLSENDSFFCCHL